MRCERSSDPSGYGAPGGTRTPGLQVRSLSLYPAELRARFKVRAPTVEIVPQHPLFTSLPMRWTLGWFCPDSGTNRDHVGRCRCARHVSADTRKQEVRRGASEASSCGREPAAP